MQEKFARLFMSIASELWLRGVIETVSHNQVHAVLAVCRLDQSIISISISATGEACGVPGDWPILHSFKALPDTRQMLASTGKPRFMEGHSFTGCLLHVL